MSANIDRSEDQREMILVPRIPTKEMLDAGWADAHAENTLGVWESMIEAWLNRNQSSSGNSSFERG